MENWKQDFSYHLFNVNFTHSFLNIQLYSHMAQEVQNGI